MVDPGMPPHGVTHPMSWRLAALLYTSHDMRPQVPGERAAGPPRCKECGQAWPCFGRQLAELGLARSGTTQSGPQPDPWSDVEHTDQANPDPDSGWNEYFGPETAPEGP